MVEAPIGARRTANVPDPHGPEDCRLEPLSSSHRTGKETEMCLINLNTGRVSFKIKALKINNINVTRSRK